MTLMYLDDNLNIPHAFQKRSTKSINAMPDDEFIDYIVDEMEADNDVIPV